MNDKRAVGRPRSNNKQVYMRVPEKLWDRLQKLTLEEGQVPCQYLRKEFIELVKDTIKELENAKQI